SMSFEIEEPEPQTGVSSLQGSPQKAAPAMALPRQGKSLDFTLQMPGAPQKPQARPNTEIAPAKPPAPPWEPPSIPGRAAPVAQDEGIVARTAPLLIDVTPLSLSVETVGGYCDTLIPANSPVPCDRTRIFITAADNQTMVCVNVAQGESRMFGENTFLGQLE